MKDIVVTGGNAGIGFETVRELARRGHRVIFTSRNTEKGQTALDRICNEYPEADVSVVQVDLTDFESIREACSEILKISPRIDVLIHNAGTFQSIRRENEAGIELSLMVNHVAPFYMTHLLLPALSDIVIHEIDEVPDKEVYKEVKGPAHYQQEEVLAQVFALAAVEPAKAGQKLHIEKRSKQRKAKGDDQELQDLLVEGLLQGVEPDDHVAHQVGGQQAQHHENAQASKEHLYILVVIELIERISKKSVDESKASPPC